MTIGRYRTLVRDESPQPRMKVAAGTADLYIYDVIDSWGGEWGVSAKEFTATLRQIDAEEIVLHINSPGGEAFEGVTIMNALRQHKARVTVMVDGYAASAASVIAMAGDEVVMGLGSEIMIHDASAIAWGNAAAMADTAARLEKLSADIAGVYAEHGGGDPAFWRAEMQRTAWYNAEEAVAAGLATRVDTSKGNEPAEEAKAHFDVTSYNRAARTPVAQQTPAADSGGLTPTERSAAVAFTDEQLNQLRAEVGVADDADETTILAALREALLERADPPAATAAAALPDGVVPIDAARLATLEENARRGAEASARQEADDRRSLVDAAVADGRIPQARAAAWVGMLAADPGAADTLAAMPTGLVPIGQPVGHSADVDEDITNTPAYQNWSR